MKSTHSLALALTLALSGQASLSQESRPVYGPDGNLVFQIRFFGPADGPFALEEPDEPPLVSTWTLNTRQKNKIADAVGYWAEIIKPAPGRLPAVINVGTFDDENAAGNSDDIASGAYSMTQIQAALLGREQGGLNFGSHAQFIMGTLQFDDLPYVPSQLPRSDTDVDLFGVAFHELAHGLGVANSVEDKYGEGTPHYDDALGTWARHLRDDNGNPARPGQAIICSKCANPYDPKGFDVRKDRGYFTGRHVDEVLAGALLGVPVRMLGTGGRLDNNYMSHIELDNSLMSHQPYRNFTNFMEAELALMQDLGYDIDRRNFFGHSVYGSGRRLVNDHGFFERNEQGTAYLPGQYNTSTLGLGLHIYGSDNTVIQRADLLTKGPGGAGIRVDGQRNTVVIEPGTRIHADGINGRGVMFAYGRHHRLIQRGDVQASGPAGIAASFDFGSNTLGNEGVFSNYRGSYIHERNGQPGQPLDELQGALVEQYDITGRLAGNAAAIYISRNALVDRINVMRGARIEGNIYSHYDRLDEQGRQRLTQLAFGRRADGRGGATERADDDFFFVHKGDIQGRNLALAAEGGYTSLNGEHRLYGVEVAPGATLAGNSRYTVEPGHAFVNHGILSPGNSLGRIDIIGDYRQSAGGRLLLEIDGSGSHDTLAVSGAADLDGRLTLAPQAGWYAQGWSLDTAGLLQAGAITGEFSAVDSQLASPTLQSRISPLGGGIYRLNIARPDHAYSRYAKDGNARQAGLALDGLAASARGDIQPLYRALDFSAPDGGVVAGALDQLSPSAYSALSASALTRERQIAGMISARGVPGAVSAGAREGWSGFAAPFGGGYWQSSHGSLTAYDANSYGVVLGAEKRSERDRGLVLGVHGAISGQSVSVNAPHSAKGKSTAFHFGLHGRYAADPRAGLYLAGQGHVGIEDGSMDRRVQVDGYSARNKADWTGLSGTLMAGGGYRWALSDTLSVGPAASLNYAVLSRPDIHESGGDASRLELSSSRFHSLRSSIGVGGSLSLPMKRGSVLVAGLQLSWDRELLNNDLIQDANFTGYPSLRFSSRNQLAGRDALGARASLRYEVDDRLALGATLSGLWSGSNYRSVSGNLSLTRRF